MINNVLVFLCLFPTMVGWQGNNDWQRLDYEYYSLEVPHDWVVRFCGEDKNSIHKRNIRVKNNENERVEYELGTLVWGTEIKNSEDFEKQIGVEIRSFRNTSGDIMSLCEVKGKIAEVSWPKYMKVITEERGGIKGERWENFLLKGESQGFSVVSGTVTEVKWDYKFFVEKKGMVYCVTITIPDKVRSVSVAEFDEMARRIVNSFKVK